MVRHSHLSESKVRPTKTRVNPLLGRTNKKLLHRGGPRSNRTRRFPKRCDRPRNAEAAPMRWIWEANSPPETS